MSSAMLRTARTACLLVFTVLGLEATHVASNVAHAEEMRVEQVVTLTNSQAEDEFPAIGRDSHHRLWVAWVSYDGKQDHVLARQLAGPSHAETVSITEQSGDYWKPAVGRQQNRTWFIWAQNDDGNWDLCGRHVEGDRWSQVIRLTNNQANDMSHRLVTDRAGRLWVTWQSVVESNYEIMLARVTVDGLTDIQNISEHAASDWEPAIAAGRGDRIVVAWDSYRNGSYDIFVRELRAGKLGPIVPITTLPDYEAHAAIAIDQEDRLWVAWDNGGSHWGQHGHDTNQLHERRSVHLCCLHGGRKFAAVGVNDVFQGELAEFCELPELIVDGKGRVWMIVRHLHDVTPLGLRSNGRPHQPRGIWNFYATCYAGDQWCQPQKLPDSNGRNDMRVSTCLDAEGRVRATWADDGRRINRAEEPINHNVHAAQLFVSEETPRRAQLGSPFQQPSVAHHLVEYRKPETYVTNVGGKTYHLLYGDTHRHTDISRCRMNFDGSLIDTYRYAIDAAGLDFLAISDHDQDLLKHRYDKKQSPLLGYAWWRSQKYCDLFYIQQRFLPIYGYEHGGSYGRRGGHKNVLYLERGMPCIELDSPRQLFQALQDKRAVVIPHQLADGASATNWQRWNADFERVAEIFQVRGSYEYFGAPREAEIQRQGHYLWDALDDDVRIGVIASSDHRLVHGAYAAVYAQSVTRQGVLDALRDRRSFGATDMMVVDFRLNDHALGEEVSLNERPTFHVTVQGTAPIKQVQIVKDGRFVYSMSPNKEACEFRYNDALIQPGESAYYYVRAAQTNNQWAWSSAIWAKW